jgi:hypothetical protein
VWRYKGGWRDKIVSDAAPTFITSFSKTRVLTKRSFHDVAETSVCI